MCQNGCTNSCSCESDKIFTSQINYDGNTIPCLDVNGDINPPYANLNDLLILMGNKLCELSGLIGAPLSKYVEVVLDYSMRNTDPNWGGDGVWYVPTGYETLTYVNNSGSEKDFMINIAYNSGDNGGSYGNSDVSCGIFDNSDLVNPLYFVDSRIKYNDGDSPTVYEAVSNNSFFKEVTLADGEGVTIQFKTKSSGDGFISKSQIFVNEIKK